MLYMLNYRFSEGIVALQIFDIFFVLRGCILLIAYQRSVLGMVKLTGLHQVWTPRLLKLPDNACIKINPARCWDILNASIFLEWWSIRSFWTIAAMDCETHFDEGNMCLIWAEDGDGLRRVKKPGEIYLELGCVRRLFYGQSISSNRVNWVPKMAWLA